MDSAFITVDFVSQLLTILIYLLMYIIPEDLVDVLLLSNIRFRHTRPILV